LCIKDRAKNSVCYILGWREYLLYSGVDFYILLITFQIVSFGDPDVMPTKTVGKYIKPKDWNALISDPDTVSPY
jgi:hypothetical protein